MKIPDVTNWKVITAIVAISVVTLTTVIVLSVNNDPSATDTAEETTIETSAANGETTTNPQQNDNTMPTDETKVKNDKPQEIASNGKDDKLSTGISAQLLPDNWDQMTLEQKIDLNPYDCQPDKDNILRISEENGQCLGDDSTEPVPNEQQASAEELEVTMQQPFPFSFPKRGMDLEVTANSFQCFSVLYLVTSEGKENLAEIMQKYKRYRSIVNSQSYSSSEDYWELLRQAEVFEYIENLRQHLNQDRQEPISEDDIAQYLDKYKVCILALTAENIGQDSKFSNGCGLLGDWDRYVRAIDDNHESHEPKYIGPGYACTEAEEPFPTGATQKSGVTWLLAQETQIMTITFQAHEEDARVIITGLDTQEQ